MKNKITALILIAAMLLSMVVTVGAQESASVDKTDAEVLLEGLGILNAETYDPDSKMTRGEFATLVSGFILYGQQTASEKWYDNTFGVENSGENILPDSPLFDDVDASHEEFEGIRTMVRHGYMNGISSGRFAPDFQIALSEAVKVAVSMLGYDEIAAALGGYPNGYLQVAAKCKLLSGISQGTSEVVSKRNVVRLFANALDVQIKVPSVVTADDIVYENGGETFLNFFLNLGKAEGTMTDNGFTSLTSASSAVGDSSLVVGGKTLKYGNDAYVYSGYIGRDVTAYYSIAPESENTCVYVQTEDDADIITEGTLFKNNVLYYTLNGKDTSVRVPRSATVIYNGVYTDSYTDEMLTVEDGTVAVIKGADSLVLVVRSYKDMLVSNVSYDAEKIYNTLKFSSLDAGKSVISLAEGETYANVLIFDENGKEITINDITKGDVLDIMESQDGKQYLEVRKSPAAPVEMEIDSWNSEEIIGLDASYEIGDGYRNATNKTDIKAGEVHKVYLNSSNHVIWVTTEAIGDMQVAVFTGTGNSGTSALKSEYEIRLYTEADELKVYKLPSKVTLNGERKDSGELPAILDDYMGKAILFSATEDTVTDITTPAPFGETDVKDWYHVSPVLNVFRDTGVEPYKTQYYEPGDGASFGGNFAYSSSATTVFTVPTSEDDFDNEKRFFINNSLNSGTSYTVEAYSTIKNDPVPEVIIIYEDSKGSGTVTRNRGLLITKVVNTVDDEGEPVTAFKGYEIKQNSLKEVTLGIAEDVMMTKVKEDYTVTLLPLDPSVDTDVAKYGPLTYTDLEPGDIIRYGTDADGKISVIRIAFDYSQMKGFDESKHVAWASFAGPVLNVNSKGLKLAYGIKPEDIDYTDSADVKLIKGFAFGGSKYPLVFVKSSGGNLYFDEGTYEDIVSYEMTGDSSTSDFACILTHFTGGRMGGVIYVR